jgi:divalent metal cation (Fe/Co/Zn/Cd) transporter
MPRKQNRLLGAIFLWLWAAFALWLGATVIVQGEFHIGRRGPQRIIKVETEPGAFWTVVAIALGAGALAAMWGLHEFRIWRRTRQRAMKAARGER